MSPTKLTTTAAIALALGLFGAQGAAAQASATATTQAEVEAPAQPTASPVTPTGDLIDTIKASGQFTTFIQAADATNLTGLLKTNTNLTVFAPTDAAFSALPKAQLDALMADKTALQKFVLHHVVNAPIPSSKIKGAKGPVPSGAGDQLMLDGSDEAGALKVDGATIIQADIKTGSGLLQVIDKVLIVGQVDASAPTGEAAAS